MNILYLRVVLERTSGWCRVVKVDGGIREVVFWEDAALVFAMKRDEPWWGEIWR